MIDEIWNTRQVNDYTGKNINKKDFMRSWTHSRTAQHISFDELLEEGTTVDGELLFDIADPRSEFESEIIHKFYMEDFKAQLPGVDSKILQMRYDGHSLKEIAAAVGFKTPSAVSKHVEKIAERYDNFISDEYGKLLSKCINEIIMEDNYVNNQSNKSDLFFKNRLSKKQLLIDCQLGRGYDNEGFDDNTLLSQKRTLKTLNSKRYVPLPDFIMDELYLARARYEETLKNDPEFDENLDFVLFRDHGKAIARPYYYFKKLMKKCNIDCTKHVWHDLRHTYATLLDQNNMNMKVVSEILGHYSEEFANEVYVIHKPEVIIYDTSEVMNSFIESLKLDSTERIIPVYDISFIQEYLF